MQQAPTRASASAFSPKNASLPTAWSGRIDPADLSRPAGLLIAALSQYARERGLTLSEMATAMDVSYWSLSQLRIGIRRLEALDEDMAAACAAFLDRPIQTIYMLAGLLDPGDALSAADLTAEDIVHARHLLATEPADLSLQVPVNRARPLQSLGVDELAAVHREWGSNPSVHEAVRAEMAQRPMSKTELLRQAIHAGMAAVDPKPASVAPEKAGASAIIRCGCQKRLRVPYMDLPGDIRCPACQVEYAVHWQDTVCVVQRHEAPADEPVPETQQPRLVESELDPAQAWAVLGLKPGSPWSAVERARRSLLQQYHPDRLGHVSPLVRQLAESAFRRVGDACELLKAQH
jgi:hypothetical protein